MGAATHNFEELGRVAVVAVLGEEFRGAEPTAVPVVTAVPKLLEEEGRTAAREVGWVPSCPDPTMTNWPIDGTPLTITKLERRTDQLLP